MLLSPASLRQLSSGKEREEEGVVAADGGLAEGLGGGGGGEERIRPLNGRDESLLVLGK